MNVEEFTSVLDARGIEYSLGASGICYLKHCPACGKDEFKVYLREIDDALLGKCFRGSCRQGYSSFKYLLMLGLPMQEVLAIHGQDPLTSLKSADPTFFAQVSNLTKVKQEEKKEIEPQKQIVDISKYMKISEWPDHPVSLYATGRGVVPEFYDRVLISPTDHAVVFLISKNGKTEGYQKRYTQARGNDDKTKISEGLEKTKYLLEFPHESGDIAICEGPFTALSAWHYGYYGICTFGAAVSEEQLDQIGKIIEKTGKRIGIAYDKDEAGIHGAKIIKLYFKKRDKDFFKIVSVGNYNDLNDAWKVGAKVSEESADELSDSLPEIKLW